MNRDREDQYNKLLSVPGVLGLVVITLDGVAVKTTLSNSETLKYAGLITPIVHHIRKVVKDISVDEDENNEDDVYFMRFRTKYHEILVSPHDNFATIVLQRPKPLTTGITEEEEKDEKLEVQPNTTTQA